MSDGKVRIIVDLDSQKAEAGVKSLKSMLEDITSSGNKTGSMFKSMLGANIVSSALTSALGNVKDGIAGIAGELNNSSKAWKTFESNLQILGKTDGEIKQVKGTLQSYAQETIYSASDMASTYAQLAAVGIESTDQLVTGFGGIAAAAENPQQAMKTLSQQGVQMAAKPTVAWQDFKLMLEQTPAGIAAVAKHMGMSTDQMVQAVQNGEIATKDFFEAIKEVGNDENSFGKMAKEAKTVDQAIDGLKETVNNKLLPAFEGLSKHGIRAVDALANALADINLDGMVGKIDEAMGKINFDQVIANVQKGFAEVFNVDTMAAAKGTLDAIGSAVGTIGAAFEQAGAKTSWLSTLGGVIQAVLNTITMGATIVQNFMQAFADTGAIDAVKTAFDSLVGAYNNIVGAIGDASIWTTLGTAIGNVVTVVSQVVTAVADFVANLDPATIQGMTTAVVTLAGGFMALRTGLKIVNGLKTAFQGLKAAMNIGSTIAQVVAKVLGLGAAQTTAAASSGAMAAGNTAVGTTAAASAGSVMRMGAAVLMVGGGIALAAAGIYLLVQAAIQLGAAGAPAAIALAGIAVGIGLLGAAAVLAGPALTAGAVGILAFGAAVLMVGVGVGIAAAGIALLATQLQPIATYGTAAAVGLAAIGAAALVVGVGALVAGAGLLVAAVGMAAVGVAALVAAAGAIALGAGLLVAAVGIAAVGVALNVGAGAFDTFAGAIAKVITAISGGLTSVLNGLANVFESIGKAALNAGKGFELLAQGVVAITETNLRDLAASLAATAAGVGAIAGAADGIGKAGTQFKQLGQGLMLITTNGTAAQGVLTNLAGTLPIIGASLTTIGPSLNSTAGSFKAFSAGVTSSLAGLGASAGVVAAFGAMIAALSGQLTAAQAGAVAFASGFAMVQTVVMTAGAAFASTNGQIVATRGTLMTVPAPLMAIGTAAIMATSQLRQIGTAAPSVANALRAAASQVRAAMQQMAQAVQQNGQHMVQQGQQAGQRTGQGIAKGIATGRDPSVSAMASIVSAVISRANSGTGAMRSAGYQMGAGLAQGMMSALGTVTAAANALVAQAERAARAKAKIHSPSRLFRDSVGRYIPQGVAVGIEKNGDYVDDAVGGMFAKIKSYQEGAERLIGSGRSSLATQVKTEVSTRQAIAQEVKVIKEESTKALQQALDVAAKAVKRPVVMQLDDGTLVAKTSDKYTQQQKRSEKLRDRMRGIK